MGLFSTPTNLGESRIEDEYAEGTQEEWQHRCPNCGAWHLISNRTINTQHKTLKDSRDKVHIVVQNVLWRCPSCAHSFTEGEMKHSPQKYVAQNPAALAKGCRSFFVNCFASPWISWAAVMQEWLEAQGDPEREKVVVNTRFGEVYEPRGAFSDTTQFLKRREPYAAELPDGVLLLTAAVDVQDNRLEYEICGWGNGEECWGIKKSVILGAPDDSAVWRQLSAQLDREYCYADGAGLLVARTFIDSGGHYTKEVYQYSRRHLARQRFAVKGSSMPGVPIIHKYSKVSVHGGRTIPLVLIGVDSGKQYVMDRLGIETPGPKYFHFPLNQKEADTTNEILWNRGYDDIYCKGLIAEQRVPRKRQGRIEYVWENIAENRCNEPLDLRVYNLAAMHSLSPNWEQLSRLMRAVRDGDIPAAAARPKNRAARKAAEIKHMRWE